MVDGAEKTEGLVEGKRGTDGVEKTEDVEKEGTF